MMFVLDFPLVSPGKCGQPLYLTSAANLYNCCSHIPPAFLSFLFFSPGSTVYGDSISRLAMHNRTGPFCSQPPALRSKQAKPLCSSIKQRLGYLKHLFSGSLRWTRPGCRCSPPVPRQRASEHLWDLDKDHFLWPGDLRGLDEGACAELRHQKVHPSSLRSSLSGLVGRHIPLQK